MFVSISGPSMKGTSDLNCVQVAWKEKAAAAAAAAGTESPLSQTESHTAGLGSDSVQAARG